MMKHLCLSLMAQSPLSIRSDQATEGAATTQAIPGTTVFGCLAAAYRIMRPEDETGFSEFFLQERLSIPYLYPARFGATTFENNLPVLPLPRTAQTCKRFPGFRPLHAEKDDEERHGIRDSLFDWGILALLEREKKHTIATLLRVPDVHKDCQVCKQAMDHVSGYYRCAGNNPGQRMQSRVETHLQTRVGINRAWGVAEESILYNREVFDETMRFWGEILVPDELHQPFSAFLQEADEEDILRIGTGRTRGLGRVQIVKQPLPEMRREDLTAFAQRLTAFSDVLKDLAREAGVESADPFYFAITLRSATVLRDEFLRYKTTLDTSTLADALDLEASLFSRIYQASEVQRISGWNEIWGTPRSHDYALTMGSTFLFACRCPLDAELSQKLYALEEHGLGQRHSEGFGRISLSDPFHQQGEQA